MRNKGILKETEMFFPFPEVEEPVFHVVQGSQQPTLGAAVMWKLAARLEKGAK